MTNHHVVMDDDRVWPRLQVSLKPEKVTGDPRNDLDRTFPATVVAKIDGYDLAVIKVDVRFSLPYLLLSDLSKIGIGEDVIAIGHPGRGGLWSTTGGRISGAFENFEGMEGRGVFQTDAAINPGNSGGPLLDAAARVVGINTFIFRKNRDGEVLEGLNFAIKSTTAIAWIEHELGRDFLPRALPPGYPEDGASSARSAGRTPEVMPDLEAEAFDQFLNELRGTARMAPEAESAETGPPVPDFDRFLQEPGNDRQQRRQSL